MAPYSQQHFLTDIYMMKKFHLRLYFNDTNPVYTQTVTGATCMLLSIGSLMNNILIYTHIDTDGSNRMDEIILSCLEQIRHMSQFHLLIMQAFII